MATGRQQSRSVAVCKSAWMIDEVILSDIREQRMNIVVFWFGMYHGILAITQPDDGGSKYLRNMVEILPDYIESGSGTEQS
jgi:hypothetical protein